jgi:hypothetical protein
MKSKENLKENFNKKNNENGTKNIKQNEIKMNGNNMNGNSIKGI